MRLHAGASQCNTLLLVVSCCYWCAAAVISVLLLLVCWCAAGGVVAADTYGGTRQTKRPDMSFWSCSGRSVGAHAETAANAQELLLCAHVTIRAARQYPRAVGGAKWTCCGCQGSGKGRRECVYGATRRRYGARSRCAARPRRRRRVSFREAATRKRGGGCGRCGRG